MPSTQEVLPSAWPDLEREVANRVRDALACKAEDREPTIVFLRSLEATARKQDGRHQTIQIIASGRRLLGDRSNLGGGDARYAYCLGRLP